MTDPAAPPPPGTDTPVPGDAAARAAAAGRAKALRPGSAPARDALVPTTAIESRAQERARMRRERAALGPPLVHMVGNPAARSPGGAALPAGPPPIAQPPQQIVPPQWQPGPYGMVYGGTPYGQPVGAGPYPRGPYDAGPYGQGPYGQGPYRPGGYSPGLYVPGPAYAPVVLPLPRVIWSGKQKRVALLSAWVGQTVMALATHLLTAFVSIVGFAFLLHLAGDSASEITADSFTSTVALWTTPDRIWATVIIGALIGGMVLALGWVISAFWARSAGLAKAHRSTWLAWLCTTVATGLFGVVYWPGAIVFGFAGIIASSSSSLTVGSMWSTLFGLLAMAVVLTGLVGMAFGWMFLTTSRPPVDFRALAEAEESAARARDEAELTQVQLRGAPRAAPAPGT